MLQFQIWLFVLIIVLTIVVGILLGFFIARKYMMKYLKDNPPITEDIVRTMMAQMGRTPSEKQVRQVMKNINSQYEFKSAKKEKKK
ncbi:YneF family protein [Mycoplasmatota bacterium]|nr:YneF family protein [Mycoplasmatota bacterium]